MFVLSIYYHNRNNIRRSEQTNQSIVLFLNKDDCLQTHTFGSDTPCQ